MTELELKELLTSFESEHVERTRAFDKADKMGEVIVAKPESGPIKPESGQTKRIIAQTYDTGSQDEAVVAIIGANPGIKREKIFLQVQTSLKSVQRTLNRLSANKKIEYRGSKRTGGMVCQDMM